MYIYIYIYIYLKAYNLKVLRCICNIYTVKTSRKFLFEEHFLLCLFNTANVGLIIY